MGGIKFVKGKTDTENVIAKVRKREGITFVEGKINTGECFCQSKKARGYYIFQR